MKRFFRKSAVNIARVALAPIYSGIGSILCLHRVVEPGPGPRISTNVALEISAASLEQLIAYLRERRVRIVSLDEVHDILTSGKCNGRFIAFTFDDGYLDNLTLALPIFKKFNAPFALNITTSLIGDSERVWWYRLEDLILKSERVAAPGDSPPLETVSHLQKECAFDQLCGRIRSLGAGEREKFLACLFAGHPSPVTRHPSPTMTWSDVKQLASDPLVTIGAHSVNHYDFNRLTETEVLFELNESRRVIESQLGRKVEHFAFPFGGRNAVGAREFALAKSCGFKTSVTTRDANLFFAHAAHMECLPRIGISGNYPTLPRFKLVDSGAVAAFTHGLRRVVTD